MKNTSLIVSFFIVLSGVAQDKFVSDVWVSDNGNGTYTNPVLHSDFSDPDVVRVGEDYYMTASSFNCSPGLPILHSKDLVNWELVNYALPKQIPLDVFDKPQHGKGVWAPCIRFHNDEYYIYYPDPDFGIYMIKTKDPKQAWSEPLLVKEGIGLIDPTPLWDDDGKVYLSQVTCKDVNKQGLENESDKIKLDTNTVYLRVKVEEGGECHFYYSTNNKRFEAIGNTFEAREGAWIGAKIGYLALREGAVNDSGSLDIDWIRFKK